MNEGATDPIPQPSAADNRGEADDSAKSLSRDQLLDALDTQIKYEGERQRSDGWTRWALWGALGAFVWIATELCASPTLNYARMMHWALLFFVLWKVIDEVRWLLFPRTGVLPSPGRYWRSEDVVVPLRPKVAVSAAQYLLVLLAILGFAVPNQWFLGLYSCLALASSITAFFYERFFEGLPVPEKVIRPVSFLTYFQIAWLGVAGWQLAAVIYSGLEAYVIEEIRLALLVNAAAQLIIQLITLAATEHRLGKLIKLRQDFAFGRVALQDAKVHAEAVLRGATLAEIFRPLEQSVLEEAAKLSSRLAGTGQQLDQIAEELEGSPAQRAEALRSLDRMGSPPSSVREQLERNKRAWRRFAGHALAFALYVKESKPEVQALTARLRDKLTGLNDELKKCLDRYSSMRREACNQAEGTTAGKGGLGG